MSRTDEVITLESRHVLQVYKRTPIVLTRGEGACVYDIEGRAYLDLISGVGVAALGHANPRLADVIADQARTLLHSSNLFFHPFQGELASRLAAFSGLEQAFFCNSGAEAVEGCLKFARRYWHTKGERQRTKFVALTQAFHGRSMGALSITWDEHYREPFAPLLPGVSWVSPEDPAALRAAVDASTAAVIVEPIQGEGGVRPLPHEFAAAVAEVCRETGTLLIADEVQCGLGRTGVPFYSRVLGLQPSLMALGKALGAGVPIGATLLSKDVAGTIAFGDHGSTYGGNLLACRAALFFLDQLEGGLLSHVQQVGAHLERALQGLAATHACVRAIRGAGLMRGIDLAFDAAPVVEAACRRGLLVNRTASSVVRLLPPLTITEAEIGRAVALLDAALAEVSSGVAV